MKLLFENQPVLFVLLAVIGILLTATLIVLIFGERKFPQSRQELMNRIKTWWFLVVLFFAAIIAGKIAATILFALVSFLALKEYFSLIPTRRIDRNVLFWAYLSIPFQYYWAYIGWYGMFIIFIPVYVFLLLPFRTVLLGKPDGFIRSVGTIHWGLMVTVFTISHIAFLYVLPEDKSPAGGVGLTIYLVVLTQFNDVAQYLWGKSLGKKKILPKVSPNKTWAGMLGGVVTTSLVGLALSPYFTPLNLLEGFFAGMIIGLAGFIGDVVISAFKRDLGIKDCGNMLPGHGGIMDRMDSMTYAAPLFFHYLYYLYY